MPRVSVLMSTYNVAGFVSDAVSSILVQTFGDFEFLILDDNSTDDTWLILQRLAMQDSRIRLFRNNRTLGLPACINRLVPEVAGEYIARMDGDDIATPGRFAIQVATLDGDGVDICGGAYVEFPTDRIKLLGPPIEDDEAKICLLFEWTLMHPTVMMRRSLLEHEQYRTEAIPAADYDLWVRLARFARFRNLPDLFLFKRVHEAQVSFRRTSHKVAAATEVRRMALHDVGITATDRELYLQGQIWTAERPRSWDEVLETEAWLVKLSAALQGRAGADRHLSQRWYKVCLKAAPYGRRAYDLFRRSELYRLRPYSRGQRLAVWVLSLLRIPYQSGAYWLLYSIGPSARENRCRIRSIARQLQTLTH
jgi:glycosyltransferase involved in cell wall biosynthesis